MQRCTWLAQPQGLSSRLGQVYAGDRFCSTFISSQPARLLAGSACNRRTEQRKLGRLRCHAIFKFKNPLRQSSDDAGTYGSQKREDYTTDDVEQYFNYMGMLAAEGTYDRLEAMLSTGTAPVDLLLLMAASENDAPKLAELIRAGAQLDVKDSNGKSARDIATSQESQDLLDQPKLAYTF